MIKIKSFGITILLFSLLILNIFILTLSDYGWWLFFSLTLWIIFVFLLWHIAYSKFEIKKKFKNRYSLLFINSLFLLFIFPEMSRYSQLFSYSWLILDFTFIAIPLFLWSNYQDFLRKNKPFLGKWLAGKRLRFLQLLMIFFIFIQAIVLFPYAFEPVLEWKSEQNKNSIQLMVNDLIKNCENDEEITIVVLNWFERHSGKMFNNWGLPTLVTGFFHPLYISFSDGHDYFGLFCNLYIRPVNRDYPSWVFTTRSGRCEEHSILFREMVNAAGLDVRSVIGKEFDHLWAEVNISGNWITVDPANVVHNLIWKNDNYTGFNLSRKYFLSRFTKNNVSCLFAEYPNGTKKIVTDRYVDKKDMANINIITTDENNNPLSQVKVEVLSNNGGNQRSVGFDFYTDNKGEFQIDFGKGNITFHATTNGFIFSSGEATQVVNGNHSYDVKIVLKSDFTNILLVIFSLIIIFVVFLIFFIRMKKHTKKEHIKKFRDLVVMKKIQYLLNKKRLKIFWWYVKKKSFVIILNIFSLSVLFILFWFFSVSIDKVVTIMLTYVLVMATGYYAIVNSRMFLMAEDDRKRELKPIFAWTLYKLVKGDQGNKQIIDFFVFLRNIGRGAAKEIELEIILTNGFVYGYGRLRLEPMLSGEKKWIHVDGFPLSLTDFTEGDNIRGEGMEQKLAIFISYQDVNGEHYPLASTIRSTGTMQYIPEEQQRIIYHEASQNYCKLEERDENFIRQAQQARENRL